MTRGLVGARTQLSGFDKSVGGSTKSFGLMAVAGIAAGAAIIKFGADSVKAAMEVQQVTAQTAAVLKSTGGQANVTAEDIEGLATELRELSGADDEAIQASSNLLLTFRDIRNEAGAGNDVFNQTQKAIVDMTTALNQGAIPSMDDLKSTTIQVGRALNDPIRGLTALRRVGVSFSEEQSTMIERLTASGDLMGAQKVILKELNKEFGGAAEAAGNTFAGSVAEARNKVEDLQEALGTHLIPIIGVLLEELVAWIEGMKFVAQSITDAVVAVDEFFRADITLQQALQSDEAFIREAAEAYVVHQDQMEAGKVKAALLEQGIVSLSGKVEESKRTFEEAGKSGRIFSKDLAESLREELPEIIGTVVKYKEAFSISPGELRRIADTWAEIGRTMVKDLRTILESDLSPAMKEGIAALPPEMRHAWVEGNKAQRAAIESSLRQTFDLKSTINRLVDQAQSGGYSVSGAFIDGIRVGFTTRSEIISIAAANAVHNAMEAAREAAKAKSPSKEMMKLGRDLIEGLRLGLDDRPLLDQMNGIIRSMIQNLRNSMPEVRKAAAELEDQFQRLQSRASDLRSAVSGGFGGFLDISGGLEEGAPGAGAFIQQQLAEAQRFASVLKALGSRNVSPALLGEIAGAGPQATPFAQQLLQMPPSELKATNKAYNDIANIAQKTAGNLSESYFGERIKEVRTDLHDMRAILSRQEHLLERLREVTVEQKGGDIILKIDEHEIGRVARDALNRIGDRNATVGLRH